MKIDRKFFERFEERVKAAAESETGSNAGISRAPRKLS